MKTIDIQYSLRSVQNGAYWTTDSMENSHNHEADAGGLLSAFVFPCVILFLLFSVLLVLRLPRLGKRELILMLFVRLFGFILV